MRFRHAGSEGGILARIFHEIAEKCPANLTILPFDPCSHFGRSIPRTFLLTRRSRVFCAARRVAPPPGGACHRESSRLASGTKSLAIIHAPHEISGLEAGAASGQQECATRHTAHRQIHTYRSRPPAQRRASWQPISPLPPPHAGAGHRADHGRPVPGRCAGRILAGSPAGDRRCRTGCPRRTPNSCRR